LVNRKCHHKSILLYAVAHHIFKTGVHSILPNIDYIIFTNHRANIPILYKVLQIFRHSQEDMQNCKSFVDKTKSSFDQYYVYSTHTNMLYFASSSKDLLNGNNFQSVLTNYTDAIINSNESTLSSTNIKINYKKI